MSEAPDQVKTIFGHALALESPDERIRYLNQACGDDSALRADVDQLLAAIDRAGSFLVARTPDAAPTLAPSLHEQPGAQIGPYKLLQVLGEGGMGTVFMAEQKEPVKRRVALKIIKPGMDTQQVIARFEAERQALALMDHPNIARVLDAGRTQSGRPFFVMELVNGVALTQYCDEKHLTPRERLELFVPICQAVQHAHQKGVIHRDLKPTNILVAEYDQQAVPKIIDFGVAKAVSQTLLERTMFTQYGQIVGTLEYMSPEQAKLNQLDIDTRSDIYSLGVVLYELLTGATPFDRHRLRSAAFDELLRIIREEEPPKPSTRLSTIDTLASVAANRNVEPQKLGRMLRGELDWIVMKALDKDRGRRYETANGLAADLQRYLSDEPVAACPPSNTYRLFKFVRRHKGPALVASTSVFLLVAGIIGTTWGLIHAERARQNAVLAQQSEAQERRRAEESAEQARRAVAEKKMALEAEKQARETADTRDATTKAVLDFVENRIFSAARPEGQKGGLGHDVTLRRAVEAALPFVDQRFTKQPLVEARLRWTLGVSFQCLGDASQAAEQFEMARALYARHGGESHRSTLECDCNLATCYASLGQRAKALRLREETLTSCNSRLGPQDSLTLASMGNLAESLEFAARYSEALRLRKEVLQRAIDQFGPQHPDSIFGMSGVAGCYDRLGQYEDAHQLHEQVLELCRTQFGPHHPETLESMVRAAQNLHDLGRYAQALQLEEDALSLCRSQLGPEHPNTLHCMIAVANELQFLKRHADSLRLREETLAILRSKVGPDHPDTLVALNNLACSHDLLGQQTDALKLREEALPLCRDKLGGSHPVTLNAMQNLAESYSQLGRHAEALPLWQQTLEGNIATLGQEHPTTLSTMKGMAAAYRRAGRCDEALPLNEKTLALRKKILGPEHPDTLQSMHVLANNYVDLGRSDEARRLHEQTLTLRRTHLGPQHAETLNSMNELAFLHDSLVQETEALRLREEILALRKSALGPEHPDTLGSVNNLVISYNRMGSHAEAVSLCEEALPTCRTALGVSHPCTLRITFNLANAYVGLGRQAESLQLVKDTLDLATNQLGAEHPDTLTAMEFLATQYSKLSRHEEAVRLRKELLERRKSLLGLDHDDTLRTMMALTYSYVHQKQFSAALQLRESILTLNTAKPPRDRAVHSNELAWLLATCPEVELRDISRAVTLAKTAVELVPQDANYWGTLGIAHYRSGDWKSALAAWEKSSDLRRDPSAYLALGRALAHFQLGDKEEAREWYDRAVQRMDGSPPPEAQREFLQSLRDEAAGLLNAAKDNE